MADSELIAGTFVARKGGERHAAQRQERSSSLNTVLRLLRVSVHVSFAALLLGLLGHTLLGRQQEPSANLLLALGLALGLLYLAGTAVEKRFTSGESAFDPSRYAVLWLVGVSALWAALVVTNRTFGWMIFPLVFVYLHVLSRKSALLCIGLMTVLVAGLQWLPETEGTVGAVFWLSCGVGFSVVVGLTYGALFREAQTQKNIVDELLRTRSELAQSQHAAGVATERERLAREIHDTLAQGLSSIVLMARAAAQSLAQGDEDLALQRVNVIEETAATNLGEARTFVRELVSERLRGSSLRQILHKLCRETEMAVEARGETMSCHLAMEGDGEQLSDATMLVLTRVAQASLSNVRDHSHASIAVLTVTIYASEVTLDVYDNGRGFQSLPESRISSSRKDDRGFGLRSVRERVHALHGTLEIESSRTEGTVVAVRLPRSS